MLFAVIERPGRSAADVLAETVRRIVADFPWPKSMRWGAGSMRWVRPLHGIVAILGEEIVAVEIEGIAVRRDDRRPPFPPSRTDHHRRRVRLCREASRLPCDRRPGRARAADPRGRQGAAPRRALRLLDDEGLVVENAGLTEWPRAAARPLRPRFPRRAARSDRAHDAHEPEIFRLHRRGGGLLAPGVRVRCQHRCERRRRSDRRGQPPRARRAPRRRALLLGAGSQGPARGAGEEARRDRLPREARHRRGQGRARREACALARRAGRRSRPTPTRSNERRASPRPTSSPAWSASFPSFRA